MTTDQSLLRKAQSLVASKEEAAAINVVRAMVATSKLSAQEWGNVLQLSDILGDEDSAAEAARKLAQAVPNDPRPTLIYITKLARTGQFDPAEQMLAQLAKTQPADPAIAYMYGEMLSQAGKFDQAERELRRALRLKPDLADAWVQIGAFRNFADAPSDVDAIKALSEKGSDTVRLAADYALGKAYDDLGETSLAFAAWKRANTRLGKLRPYDANILRAMEGAAQRTSLNAPQDEVPAQQNLSPTPIFVIGAPRTGTTLVEQILAAHRDVYGLGESLISRVATWPVRHLSPADMTQAKERFGPDLWPIMGEAYCGLAKARMGGESFMTDKAAMLHLFAGILARAMPQARFIWVRRDTKAAALSAYRTYFTSGNNWSCDLRNTVTYLEAHDRLMQAWQSELGPRLLAVRYEDLAAEPDVQIPRLTSFAGLPDHAGPAEFYRSTRPISTASLAQVRQPITTNSVDYWQKYAAEIENAVN